MLENTFAFPTLLMSTVYVLLSSSIVLIVIAILSAKSMGGRLGMGLKKIAAGSIMHALLFSFLVMLQNGWETTFSPVELRMFFLIASIVASIILISGFRQIYKISKELKLFY